MRLRGLLATHDFAQGAVVGNASAELRRSSARLVMLANCLAASRRLEPLNASQAATVKDATGQVLTYVYALSYHGD